MILQFFLLAAGLAIIIKSADILINGVVRLARRYGISSFVIAITVVAFGTSAPELTVGIISGLSHTNQLTLGDVVGSSIANMALIAGLSAVIFPLLVKDTAVRRELPFLFLVQVALGVMFFTDGQLSRLEGIIMLVLFAGYMLYVTWDAKRTMRIQIDPEGGMETDGSSGCKSVPEPDAAKNHAMLRLWVISGLSLLGLFLGGKLTVDSSTTIAAYFGLSQTLIGLTVVALATSMPELITSLVAAKKKEPDIILGNCIGSNILNILLVLGVSTAISPIRAADFHFVDLAATVMLTAVVFAAALFTKKLSRPVGIIFVAGYVAYLVFKVTTAVS